MWILNKSLIYLYKWFILLIFAFENILGVETRYIVYLHKNKLNGKVYVGITHYINNPNKRWANGKGYKNNSILNKAILIA